MEILVFIVSLIAGACFLRLAFLNLGKEKYPTSTLFGLVGAFFILCSFPWFQGFAKTWIVSNVNSKLAALGEQIDGVQKTTGEMHVELSTHQKQIDEHQKELDTVQSKIRKTQSEVAGSQTDITNQFHHLSSLENELSLAQTNLLAQQTKIEDVEYLVKNLFGITTNETFSSSDSNHVWFEKGTDGGVHFIVRLSSMPIIGSVHTYVRDGSGFAGGIWQILGRSTASESMKNICAFGLYNYAPDATSFYFEYVIDARETNIFRRMPTSDSIRMVGTSTRITNQERFY